MHVLNHKGRHFSVQGPLTVARTPQGQPVVVQAGASEQGQEIAAANTDIVFVAQTDLPTAQAYYTSVKRRLAKYGRLDDHLKIRLDLLPIVGHTEAKARAKHQRLQALIHPPADLAQVYGPMGDLSGFPLDGPVPEPVNPEMRSRANVLWEMARREKLSIRQL